MSCDPFGVKTEETKKPVYFSRETENLEGIIENLSDDDLTSFFKECEDRELYASLQDAYGVYAKMSAKIPNLEVKREMEKRGLDTSYKAKL